MTDWADEIAENLCTDNPGHVHRPSVARALRKAKADGLREAAKYAEMVDKDDVWKSSQAITMGQDKLHSWLRAQADKIEKGE